MAVFSSTSRGFHLQATALTDEAATVIDNAGADAVSDWIDMSGVIYMSVLARRGSGNTDPTGNLFFEGHNQADEPATTTASTASGNAIHQHAGVHEYSIGLDSNDDADEGNVLPTWGRFRWDRTAGRLTVQVRLIRHRGF